MPVYNLDASNRPLGRLASEIVGLLRGKNSPSFLPYKESGTVVIVENVDKLILTGKKMEQKEYFRHSGYPGGEKHIAFKGVFARYPEKVLRSAVLGMLPKNKLRDRMIKNLKFNNAKS